jgi:HSP20 family molecular chaperone IbpA
MNILSPLDEGLSMPRSLFPGSSLLVGFDEMEQAIDRLSRTGGDGFPPYNIERFERDNSELLRITLALAGFTPEQIDITFESGRLSIEGRQDNEPERIYLHQGIATRSFRRSFVLAAGIEVAGAELENGLLVIDLVRPHARRDAKQIRINARG